jgi:RNA polymerase sigma factor (sigma-70 family)
VPEPVRPSTQHGASVFVTTRWSAVLAAGQADGPQAKVALDWLCRTYWYPLYAYGRRRGYTPDDAQDLTQGFFARLIEKNYLADAAREKGRFRSFILTVLKHFLSDEQDKARSQKRGGQVQFVPLDTGSAEDRYQLEPMDELSPDRIFERRWAMTVLEQAAARLRESYEREDKAALYLELARFLAADGSAPSYLETASRLQLTESAVRSAIHRLRQRHRNFIRDAVAQTVSTAAEIDQEIRHLISVLAR